MDDSVKRWTMSVTYRAEVGPVVVDHEIDEIAEAHDIIERGPDWNAILDICIQLTNVSEEGVTLQSPLQRNDDT